MGYLQQLGDLPDCATDMAHLPHRYGLLLTDLLDVVLRSRADLLNLLFQGNISVQGGLDPTSSVSLCLEVIDVAPA